MFHNFPVVLLLFIHLPCRNSELRIAFAVLDALLYTMAGKPVLCFVDSEEATTTLASDRRVTVQRPCASAREYGDMIRSFVATKFPTICTK